MPELLLCGVPVTMVANTIYALPAVKCTLFTDGTTPTIQQSNTSTFTANVAVTLTAGVAPLSGGFLRCTSGNILVTVRKG